MTVTSDVLTLSTKRMSIEQRDSGALCHFPSSLQLATSNMTGTRTLSQGCCQLDNETDMPGQYVLHEHDACNIEDSI